LTPALQAECLVIGISPNAHVKCGSTFTFVLVQNVFIVTFNNLLCSVATKMLRSHI